MKSFKEYPQKRMMSMALDFMTVIAIYIISHMPLSIYLRSEHPVVIGEKYVATERHPLLFFFSIIVYAIMLNKDAYHGRSLGKFIFGFQLVNFRTKEEASPFRCFVRNLTVCIWPVELIFAFLYPKRRLGDILAGTELREYDLVAIRKFNWIQLILPILLSLFCSALLVYALQFV